MNRVRAVAARELRSFFDHPTAYILLVVFLVVSFFFFFRDAYLVDEATLRPMMGLLPWLLLFFVPAVTMRSIAEEKRGGTIELVLAQPISVLEFVLGKFLGALSFQLIALAATLGLPLGLSIAADMEWGVVAAQYVGSVLLMSALVAISLWASSLTRNQVTAFILGLAVTFLLFLIGLEVVVLGLPSSIATLAAQIGILGHFQNIARGVIDLRDVLYFGAVTAAFLALTYFSLMRERLSSRRSAYQRLRIGTLMLVLLAVFTALAGSRLRGRLDLTPERVYTLSPATRDILSELDDLVTLKLFRSREIPPQFGSIKRDVEDLLRDFDVAGGSNVNLIYYDPQDDPEALQEARTLGIQPLEFNVFGETERSVREGYLGLAVQHAGENETIPFVSQSADLEYRLISLIRSLTAERRPRVAFLSGHGELLPSRGLSTIAARLREAYAIETIALDSAGSSVPDSIDVVVVAGPQTPVTIRAGEALLSHLQRGGGMFLLHPGPAVELQTLFARAQPQPVLDSLLMNYGVGVLPDLAYDLRSFQEVQMPSPGGFMVIRPYYFWPYANPAAAHPIVRNLQPVPVRWPSPLLVEDPDTSRLVPLLATTRFAGRTSTPASVSAEQDWSGVTEADLEPQLLAAALLGGTGEPDDPRPSGRVVLTGTETLVADDVLRESGPQGWAFFQNALDWLVQDEALISIRAKDRTPPRLVFGSEVTRALVKWGNLLGVPALFILYGMFRLARRRSSRGRVFQPEGQAA